MVDVEGSPDRSSTVACGGLDIKLLERGFAQDPAVGGAVQRDATRQAKTPEIGLAMDCPHHREQDIFCDELNARRDVGVILITAAKLMVVSGLVTEIGRISRRFGEEVTLRVARGAKEPLELGVEGLVRGMVVREIGHVEGKPTVVVWLHKLPDLIGVLGSSVRRHAHDLVLPFVDLKSKKCGEDAVEQPE